MAGAVVQVGGCFAVFPTRHNRDDPHTRAPDCGGMVGGSGVVPCSRWCVGVLAVGRLGSLEWASSRPQSRTNGAVAQPGERCVRNAEGGGSSPPWPFFINTYNS